ncbi:hypothetical protein SCUCBS95973_001356 [Sporothrix curviconia]|uniref:Uncharacterized protein n=1 Tax=Sporothrix curviconia TaxID=1260050 RepID=A0ABP0AY09_9PEZI
MYLRHHGDDIHQALDVRVNPTTYSEDRQQLEVLVTPNVKAALEWYRKENSDVEFDVLNCSWDDLFVQMARAQGDHEARVNRKGNWFKYLWRKAGTQKEAIEPWLQLIPDEYGLSLVRGAIAIVFHIAEKSHEKEKSLLEGFELITETIHNAMSKGKNLFEKFKNKQEKQKSVNIEGMLKKVQKKSTELDQCAERILARKAIETHEGIGHLQLEAGTQRSMITEVRTDQTHLVAMAHETSNSVKLMDHKLSYIGYMAESAFRAMSERERIVDEEKREFMNKDREQIQAAVSAQNFTMGLLAEYFKDIHRTQNLLMDEQNQIRREIRRSLTPVPDRRSGLILQPEALMDILRVPFRMVNDDLTKAFQHGSDFSRQAHEQAQSLFLEPMFRDWMGSRNSEFLLVDGNDSSATRRIVSPMSHLCAQMSGAVETMHGRGNVVLLHFWCSMHVDRETTARGPRGMVRTLLAQLVAVILIWNHEAVFDFGHVDGERAFLAAMEDGSLSALHYAFTRLLKMVPRDMPIYCIIDNVAVFEDERFRADLVGVVHMLQDIVSVNRHCFKVLLTCPFRNTYLMRRGHVSDRDHVVLQAGGRGGLGWMTDRSVLSHISRDYPRDDPQGGPRR